MRSGAISETIKVKLRPKYDNSNKEYEVQVKWYIFEKYTRKQRPSSFTEWHHHKYYSTIEGALDAIRDIRKQSYCVDYPGYGNIENEKKYSHIKPTLNIYRYRIVKREFI